MAATVAEADCSDGDRGPSSPAPALGAAPDPVALAQQDLCARRSEYLFRMPSCVARPLVAMLADPRDEPIVHLLCNQALLVLPAVALLYAAPPSHLIGALYFAANYALFIQRYMLTLHVTAHRQLFRTRGWGVGQGVWGRGACVGCSGVQ